MNGSPLKGSLTSGLAGLPCSRMCTSVTSYHGDGLDFLLTERSTGSVCRG